MPRLKTGKFISIVLLVLTISVIQISYLKAQLSGTQMIEWQLGNIPFNGNQDYSTAYHLSQLRYNEGSFEGYIRYEQFFSPIRGREYQELTQRLLRYNDDGFTIQVGNLYEMIGRGTLFRAYEIPGAVYEDLAFRSRYGFYRDLDGFSVKYESEQFELKILRGRPLVNLFPPGFDTQTSRPDLIEAGQISWSPNYSHQIGLLGLVHRPNESDKNIYQGLFYTGQLSDNFSVYGEWVSEHKTEAFIPTDTDLAYAGYLSLNYSTYGFGSSLEYKHYNRFQLGSGFNDPPALIKEHTYPVLNRQTHILFNFGESGWQSESFKLWDDGSQTTINLTTLQTFNGLEARYTELFLEHSQEFETFTLKGFYDYAIDEPKFQRNRHSAGLALDWLMPTRIGLQLDVQGQQFENKGFNQTFQNAYAAITVSKPKWASISLVAEWSTDWVFTDIPTTLELEEGTRRWVGANFNSLFHDRHKANLFVGKRRGGPACTSGICYEVQDFTGAEIRYTLTF